MYRSQMFVFRLMLVGVVASIGFMAWSAPITMLGPLSGEVRSLAHLNKVRLIVERLPPAIYDAGIRVDRVGKSWKERLVEAGIAVVDDADAPSLRVMVVAATDETVKDAIAYSLIITLEQPVQIPRIDLNVRIPTWTGVNLFVRAKDELPQTFHRAMNAAFDKFVRRTRMATNRY